MEHTLLIVLVCSTVLTMLLSFILRDVVLLRWISCFFILFTMFSVPQAVLYVGFGSQNAIPYYGTMSGDPGTTGELQVFVWGFFGLLIIQGVMAIKLTYEGIMLKKNGKVKNPLYDNMEIENYG
jgi:hypothetical protein